MRERQASENQSAQQGKSAAIQTKRTAADSQVSILMCPEITLNSETEQSDFSPPSTIVKRVASAL